MTSLLSAQQISALRSAAAQQIAVEVVAETGSTNGDLLSRLDQLENPVLLAAEIQSRGRGRAGRPWHSAPGTALTFSLAWKFTRPLHALTGLPLAVGVAIAQGLATFGIKVYLKWPNDVLIDGKKLAGVLIESARANQPGHNWAVIGIGMNIAVCDRFAERVGQPVAQLPQPDIDRNLLLATLLNNLAQALLQFEAEGLAAFVDRWNQLHAHAGCPVQIRDGGRVVNQGRAAGIDANGCLLLDTEGGQVAVMAGDVSLRAGEE